ncbi:MAG: 3-mercaptopyruvate sulfurtransferase [Alphaproteobacteria bacterium]|nr:3-mercaptopyruvate sulfurtransferase [Alphaproteobacteria bacterium]
MPYAKPEALVSTDWLARHLQAPDVRVVDCTYILPPTTRNARREYEERHIPGAVFFDIDDIADSDNPLPHMLPSAEKFSSRVRKLGLGDGSRIVVYDTHGMMSAARAWWMFRAFGHDDVAVLDGGLPKWLKEGRPVEDMKPMPRERHFTSRMNQLLVRDLDQVRGALEKKREQVLDARSSGRFKGVDPEPRQGLRGGHMPGALNVPYASLLDPETKTFLPAERLSAVFKEAGVDLKKPIVTSCGSGVTACIVALGLYLLGRDDVAVYDGSWTEWGGRADTPVVTG